MKPKNMVMVHEIALAESSHRRMNDSFPTVVFFI